MMPATAHARPDPDAVLLVAAVVACCLPTLLAYNLPPSATLLNQCVAVGVWGGWAMALGPGHVPRATWPLLAALGLVAGAVVASFAVGGLPPSLGWSALGLLAGAALMVAAGADSARRPMRLPAVAAAFFAGLLVAGVLSAAVAWVQVFAPQWTDGQWMATSGLPGRAVGNLRQPNHLCSLLLWAVVAAVALHELRWLARGWLWGLVVLMVFAIELTASRTGAVGLLVLLGWGVLDRRLSRSSRLLLVAAPLLYALAYAAMAWYGDWSHTALGAEARLETGGIGDAGSPNSRSNIWRNAWALVMAQPWRGVGFGEFNFAWSLTPFAGRPTAFFDHTHNLPLQLAVELGLPLSGLVLALLAWALWRAWRAAVAAAGADGPAARSALVVVVLAALHSMVEYPLWYAYFLLPTAFAWGMALAVPAAVGQGAGQGARAAQRLVEPDAWRVLAGLAAGALMTAGGALAVIDYLRVVVIYAPPDDGGSLEARIVQGQHSVLFAHHADYAAATNDSPPAAKQLAFARAPHSLLDTRLMVAWAEHLARHGQVDQARWVAARLKEFRNREAEPFFEPCGRGVSTLFQCQAPKSLHSWREFVVKPGALKPMP